MSTLRVRLLGRLFIIARFCEIAFTTERPSNENGFAEPAELNRPDHRHFRCHALNMAKKRARPFKTDAYLATAGPGRTIVHLKAKEILSSQGGAADCLFYLGAGGAKLTTASKAGKEVTVTLLAPGGFFGEECMAGPNEVRTTSATAITACVVLKNRQRRTDPGSHRTGSTNSHCSSFSSQRPAINDLRRCLGHFQFRPIQTAKGL